MRRMMLMAVVAATLAPPATAGAHPSVSVVMDKHGNVFYSDLKRVMMVAPDGTKSIAVPNVHTHEMFMDAQGNLYGDHQWSEGDRPKRWGHRVWMRAPDGTITDIVPASDGHLDNYGFARDSMGTMYWAARGSSTEIRKRVGGGAPVVHSRGPFTDVRWMVAAADGTLYLIDSADLKKVLPDGRVIAIAPALASRSLSRFAVKDAHRIMGLWLDAGNNVYAAGYGSGEVKRVTPTGDVSVVSSSALPWSPTGGMVAPNGDLWILEASLINEVRLKRISRNGAVKFY